MDGYISGLNAGVPTDGQFTGEVGRYTDIEAIRSWLDNYCKDHPLDIIQTAGNELYRALAAQQCSAWTLAV
jgi:hypothetical protein